MNINELVGKRLTDIDCQRGSETYHGKYGKGDRIIFRCSDEECYDMYHDQDCSENVRIEDICGDLRGLTDGPIINAYESSNEGETADGHQTWTFYTLATETTTVVIRWLGESSGYYSERVNFEKL